MKHVFVMLSFLFFFFSCSGEKGITIQSVCNVITNPALISSTPENIVFLLKDIGELRTSDSGSTYHYFMMQKETTQVKRISATYSSKRTDIRDGFVLEGFGINLSCNGFPIEEFKKCLEKIYSKVETREMTGATGISWPLDPKYDTFLYKESENPCIIKILIQTKTTGNEEE